MKQTHEEKHQETDVLIVGAGPVGLFSVFACGMLRLRTIVVEALPHLGGQCATLYPDKPIYDIPAFPQITGKALVDRLLEQARPFQAAFFTNTSAQKLEVLEDGKFLLSAAGGRSFKARGMILAIGNGAFAAQRPPLPGIEALEGQDVFYHVPDQERFRGKHIVIAGGGDSAVDWALHMAPPFSKSLTLVHRRDKFRAHPESEAQLRELMATGRIRGVFPYQLHALETSEGRLRAVVARSLEGEDLTLEAEVLLPCFGLSTDLGPLAAWGLERAHNRFVVDPTTMETSLSHVHAVGDGAWYPNKQKLILCGFSEAAQAARALFNRFYPDRSGHFEHSTTAGIPG